MDPNAMVENLGPGDGKDPSINFSGMSGGRGVGIRRVGMMSV